MDYEITETFKGSPNGSTVVDFQAGETATEKELGPELVKAALAEGWIKPAKAQTPKPAKTPAKKTGS